MIPLSSSPACLRAASRQSPAGIKALLSHEARKGSGLGLGPHGVIKAAFPKFTRAPSQ